jgi:hypothetical protein
VCGHDGSTRAAIAWRYLLARPGRNTMPPLAGSSAQHREESQ